MALRDEVITGIALADIPCLPLALLLERLKDTPKKSSFPRKQESRVLILLGFAFGKNDSFEEIRFP